MQSFKNIIFDLGGVFLNLNYQLTENAFVEAGISNFHELFTQHHVNPLFHLLETGKITEAAFYHSFRKETGTHIDDAVIRNAWNAMLLSFPKERIDWLKEVNKKYKTFLFSNTNQIHYEAFMKIVEASFDTLNFNALFIKAYYSHQIGLRKPDKEAFELILKEQHLKAAETLFIDDTPKNIEGAKSVGLQTMLLQPPLTLLNLNV